MPGSGKTLDMTFVNITHFQQYQYMRANYLIRGMNNYVPLELEDLGQIKEPTVVSIDEAYVWADARNAMDAINIYLSYHLFQGRKRGIGFLVSTQIAESVDVRFRLMANVLIVCERRGDRFHYQPHVIQVKNRRRTIRKITPYSYSLQNASYIFPYYDTFEIVESSELREANAKVMSPERRKARTKEIVEAIFKSEEYGNQSKITRPNVRAFLFNEGFAMSFEDDAYYAIQRELDKLPKPEKKKSRSSPKERLFNAFNRGD